MRNQQLIKIEDSPGLVSRINQLTGISPQSIVFCCDTYTSESLIFIIIMYHLELTPKSCEFSFLLPLASREDTSGYSYIHKYRNYSRPYVSGVSKNEFFLMSQPKVQWWILLELLEDTHTGRVPLAVNLQWTRFVHPKIWRKKMLYPSNFLARINEHCYRLNKSVW
jgi:hypothetical protein